MRRRPPNAAGAPPARRRPTTPRAPALFVLAALLVAGIMVERNAGDAVTGEAASVETQVPIAAPASARSSAWYCPGAPVAGALGEGSVVVANAGDRPLTGSLTVFPDQGENRTIALSIGAAGRTSIRLADVVSSPFAAALIELDGGEAVAEVMASGPLGDTVSPCSSSASSSWYFAEGVTTRDATEVLLALNPFPDDAVVDVVFSTEEGVVTPQALTGLLVQGQALTSINVGNFVQRREERGGDLDGPHRAAGRRPVAGLRRQRRPQGAVGGARGRRARSGLVLPRRPRRRRPRASGSSSTTRAAKRPRWSWRSPSTRAMPSRSA